MKFRIIFDPNSNKYFIEYEEIVKKFFRNKKQWCSYPNLFFLNDFSNFPTYQYDTVEEAEDIVYQVKSGTRSLEGKLKSIFIKEL